MIFKFVPRAFTCDCNDATSKLVAIPDKFVPSPINDVAVTTPETLS